MQKGGEALNLILSTQKGNVDDITNLTNNINWGGDIRQCARTLSFDLVSLTDSKQFKTVECELGDSVSMKQDGDTLFNGIIVSMQKSTESNTISVQCFDRGFYLKRNKASYKFTAQTPAVIAKRVCADFGIETGKFAAPNITISRNFLGVELYKIIMTAYTLAAQKDSKSYYAYFCGTKLNVIEKKPSAETLVIESGVNLMSASSSKSIENMVTQVAIYSQEDTLIRTIKNAEALNQYGVLQEYIKQEKNESAEAEAKKILSDRGIEQKITVDNLGDISCVTGKCVIVKESYTGLYGLFYIDTDTHTWKNGLYFNKLVLNFKNIMDETEVGSIIEQKNKSGKKKNSNLGVWEYINKPGG